MQITHPFAYFPSNLFYIIFVKAEFFHVNLRWKEKNFEETLCLQPRRYVSISLHLHLYSTPISIKVASEKNDAWSIFHSPRCIIVASLVNYVPATSLNLESKGSWRFYATPAER